jgi:hypothetical protein
MSQALFKKAERKQAKLKIAVTGPSGSGKTMSSLKLAAGIGKRIALIDTENHSASLYADHKEIDFPFDVLTIEAPYTVAKYMEGIEAAESSGYDVLIIDSLSHVWAGDGGLLAKKESLDQRGGNSFSNWAGISKEHEALKAKLLNCNIHLICTMRSKQDYVLEVTDKGKSAPRKVGLAPIQREGMEYEFTTVFDIAMDHHAAVSKDRTGLFEGTIEKLNKAHGEKLMKWLGGAKTDAKPLCRACGAVMVINRDKTHYFCPNFQNEKNKDIKHTTFMAKALDNYIQSQIERQTEPHVEKNEVES